MNVAFLNPFVEAAREVLKAEVGIVMERGEISMQKSSLTAEEVTVLISLVGEVEGLVLYGTSIQTAVAFAGQMLDQKFETFSELAQSGIAELGNVITGRASVKLADADYESTISPPTLIQGHGLKISTLAFPRVVVPLLSSIGQLTVHLAIRESPRGLSEENFIPLIEENVNGGRALASIKEDSA